MSMLTHIPPAERLQWKLALLQHRPHDLPGRHMPYFQLGALQSQALDGEASMPEHWEQAVLAWRARGFGPPAFLLLHRAVTDLAVQGFHISSGPGGSDRGRLAGRGYQSWRGRPAPGVFALDIAGWGAAAEWINSAVRQVALDTLDALEQRSAQTTSSRPAITEA